MKAVTFVSSNHGKSREVADILRPFGIRVRWRRRKLGEPQADDLESVVRAKLRAVGDIPGKVLVEDSGLFIPALGGFPGVYSSYIEKIWGKNRDFEPFLDLLRKRDRRAIFRTVAGLRSGSRVTIFKGETVGSIARQPRGDRGFGYDPIFIPVDWKQTFAQAPPNAKNAISHRARALKRVGEYLRAPRREGRRARTASRGRNRRP
ncbi:MAG: non-canonical purine NTP pyrophosphatase [Thermoplasmata archaeon]